MRTNLLWVLCVLVLVGLSEYAEEVRVWTSSKNGRQFKGALVKVEGDSISIRRESDAVVFQVKRADLIQGDLEWIDQNSPGAVAAEDLSGLIAGVPSAKGVPAVGVLLVSDGKTRGVGVAGVREAGGTAEVEATDRWHLGSCTKSMTATLAAALVEDGAIGWGTSLSEILGKKVKMRDAYGPVTLGMLLSNRSGIPGKVPNSVYASIDIGAQVADLKDREIMKQRLQYAEAVLNIEPSHPPDSAYEYSNAGFVVAGVMLEVVSGKPWEKLIEERLFAPLGMVSSGFGNAARGDRRQPTQPWPHKDGKTPVAPGGGDDNPWVIGPAGTVHCSLGDAARYIAMHAARETGPVLKEKGSFEFLHRALPDNEDYARGWIVSKTGWSVGPAITHDGSNTMNHCSIWIAPEAGRAVAAFTNCGEGGRDACQDAVELVVGQYFK